MLDYTWGPIIIQYYKLYFDFINGSIPIVVRLLPIKSFYYLFNIIETKLVPNHNGNVRKELYIPISRLKSHARVRLF